MIQWLHSPLDGHIELCQNPFGPSLPSFPSITRAAGVAAGSEDAVTLTVSSVAVSAGAYRTPSSASRVGSAARWASVRRATAHCPAEMAQEPSSHSVGASGGHADEEL